MRRVLAMVTISVVLVACAADGASTPAASVDAGAVPVQPETLTLVGGSTIDLEAARAARPVALWFWAPG